MPTAVTALTTFNEDAAMRAVRVRRWNIRARARSRAKRIDLARPVKEKPS